MMFNIHAVVNVLFLVFVTTIKAQLCKKCEVENLEAEPDFRSVKLKWSYHYFPEPLGFKVRFCEVSTWNTKVRCREKKLPITNGRSAEARAIFHNRKDSMDNLVKMGASNYEAYIFDLRTLTNYSFNVKADLTRPLYPQFVYDKSVNQQFSSFYEPTVVVETKGFSARTSLCLANTSDVLVNTGPFFGGKVAVENATDERCAIFGNRSDSKDVYHFTIIHDICGSKIIDNSRIETMIMVHENKDILTHNSRRYLVVCNFVPETYTIQASVDMPPHLLKRKKSEEEVKKAVDDVSKSAVGVKENSPNHIFTYERHKHNNVRDSRMLAHQQHKLLDTVKEPKRNTLQDAMTTVFIIVGVIGTFVVTLFWYFTAPKVADEKTKSVADGVNRNSLKSENESNEVTITFKGSPVALVSIKSCGESSA